MDAGTVLGIIAGWASAFATLLAARYGGTFRRRSLVIRFGGYPLARGKPLAIVYGIPDATTTVIGSLSLELANLGGDTVEDATITIVLPQILGTFFDEKAKKPTVKFVQRRGPDAGVSSQVEKVGIHHHLHMMVRSIHPLVTVGLEVPIGLPGPTGNHKVTVPVNFRDGIKASIDFVTSFVIPIDVLVMAKDRRL
jgi:hypothetical protein